MIEQLPLWIPLLFLFCWLVTMVFFYYANGKPKGLMVFIILWSIIHSLLAYLGFYQITDTMPPRYGLVLVPATLLIIFSTSSKQRTRFIERRDINISTFLHSVRLPVEIVLFGLCIHKMIPELMTFEGRNFDILMGITAPIVGWLHLKRKISKKILLIWNCIGVVLVLFILSNGILSAEFPFQQFGFEQPNRGINYFPFVLLPEVVVPIVVWTHIIDILKLRSELKSH